MTEFQLQNEDFRPLAAQILEEDIGSRLDSFLATRHPFLSRSQWQERITRGELLVKGKKSRPSRRLDANDYFHFRHPKSHEPDVDPSICPIWKSGDIMAVYKPGNLPMHENGPYRKNTFSHILSNEIGEDWAAVHRLDRETSGIVLCGRTHKVRKALALSLSQRSVEKEYHAFALGNIERDFFNERGPIGDLASSSIRIKKWITPNGLSAETAFHILDRKPGFTYIRAFPKTGRTNQIRIHAAANNLPLVGDKLYYPDEKVFEEYYQNRGNTKNIVAKTGFHRLCLHAYRIKFLHPESSQECEIFSPLPQDMTEFWNSLPLDKKIP